jgi:hypothetical protein
VRGCLDYASGTAKRERAHSPLAWTRVHLFNPYRNWSFIARGNRGDDCVNSLRVHSVPLFAANLDFDHWHIPKVRHFFGTRTCSAD